MIKKFPPFYWAFDLAFYCPEPYFRTIASTTYINALVLSSGTATTQSVTYAGSVWTEPVWTLSVSNTNAAAIQSLQIQNTMSGDSITAVFPGGLAASTAWTVTIDSSAMSVRDNLGNGYDVVGSAFPLLYGPAGQAQTISATLTPVSGTATGCTLSCVAFDRWLI